MLTQKVADEVPEADGLAHRQFTTDAVDPCLKLVHLMGPTIWRFAKDYILRSIAEAPVFQSSTRKCWPSNRLGMGTWVSRVPEGFTKQACAGLLFYHWRATLTEITLLAGSL